MPATPIIRSYEAKVDDVKPAERAVISRIGGMDIDRHRTIIAHRGIDLSSYTKNPIVLHEHGKCPTRGSLPVGKNQWIKIDGDKMIAKTIFRDDAYSTELFNAYKDDWMRGWSINVISHDASPPTDEEMRSAPNLRNDCDLIYRHTELIEYSTTSAPSHRDALTILVERGIWVPDEALAEMREAATRTSVSMLSLPAPDPAPETEDRTMTDSAGGMASGGAVVKDAPPKGKRKPKDDDEDEDEDEGEKEGDEDDKDDPEKRDAVELVTIVRRIVKKNGKFFVYSEDGSKKLGGPYATKAAADKRLGEIEYFKHHDEERSAPSGKLEAIKEAIKGLPDLCPDYGQVFYDPDNDKVFINFSDSDERDTTRKWIAAMEAIVGKGNADGEAEVGVEKYKSWIQVRSCSEPIQHDGHGGWTARGFPDVTFPSREVAEQAIRATEAPRVSPAEVLRRYDREIAERNAAVLGEVQAQIDHANAQFELKYLGIV